MTKPNILLFTWHDLGRHLGCYGRGDVPSPHLDELAAGGVRFDRMFCTSPVCSPARGSLMTGRYPFVNGLAGLVNCGWDLPREEKTIEHYLRDAGYHTGLIGHQHERSNPEDIPLDTLWRGSTHCDQVAPAAQDFLRQWKDPQKPFFLRVGFGQIHRPWPAYDGGNLDDIEPLPPFPDSPALREHLGRLRAYIKHADAAVGRVLATLRESGLDQDTLVIFYTDHGLPFPLFKGSLFDRGLGTAFLMRWPGVLPEGRACPGMLSHVDILPTLLDLIGISVPDAPFNGHSFAGVLEGRADEINENIYGQFDWSLNYAPQRCVRTRSHKYILNFEQLSHMPAFEPEVLQSDLTQHLPVCKGSYRPAEMLYDLEADPHELNNLAYEPSMAALLHTLRGRLRAWMQSTADPLLQGPTVTPNYRRVVATLLSDDPAAPAIRWNPHLARVREGRAAR